jgi:acyl-CoA thioesterase
MHFGDFLQQIALGQSPAPTAQWAQGRATFGGLTAALAFQAMRVRVPAERACRAVAVSFVAPVAPASVDVQAQLLRAGRAVTQAEGRVVQDGQVAAVAVGSFGEGRESALAVPAEPAPERAAPEECLEVPYLPGVSPAFTQYFAFRWAVGERPFQSAASRVMGGWIRFREPPARVDEAHLLGLVDAWPPAILPMMARPAPSSSLTWSLEFVHPAPIVSGAEWLYYEALVDQSAQGYGHIQARLWSRAGRLLVLSRQTVAVFG